jgi:RNA polymerase sigma factor (sigma-70 family)
MTIDGSEFGHVRGGASPRVGRRAPDHGRSAKRTELSEVTTEEKIARSRMAPSVATHDWETRGEFVSFYREFIGVLVRFLLWQGASLADAAEVAQDTMQRAYRWWSRIDRPEGWCRRVASREYVRRFARADVPAGVATDGGPLLTAGQSQVQAWEEGQEVLRLLALLPIRQRQVMAWTYDGYQPAEIAKELGITAETVRSNLRKARRALAAQLLGDGAWSGE